MKDPIGWTRLIVGIGAFSSVLVGALLFISAGFEVVHLLLKIPETGFGTQKAIKDMVVTAVEHADTVLIAAALVIIGIGLYALFVGKVHALPHWLEVENLDDLKDKLVSVVVAVLAVNFFTRVVEWDGGPSILYLGAGVGLVIVSLAAYSGLHLRKKSVDRQENVNVSPRPHSGQETPPS